MRITNYETLEDVLLDLNALSCQVYEFGKHYHCGEAIGLFHELYDVAEKHGLYGKRFKQGKEDAEG